MKKILFIVIFTCILMSSAWAETPAQQLQKILNSVSSLQANFTQKNYAGRRVVSRSHGSLAMLKPGYFRWNIRSPSQVLMISNGQLLWIYDKNLAQVTVKRVNRKQGSSAAMILSNRIRLLGNYFNIWKKNGWYYLNPKYKTSDLKQVQLRFNGNRLSQMWLLDNLGQRSLLTFSNVRINLHLNKRQFTFRAPKGVDVIQ